MTDLVQRLREGDFGADDILDAADALEAKDKEIARLREERVNALFHFPKLVDAAKDKKGSCIICGINPSMAAIWCDDYIKLKALCDQMANALDQLTFAMDLRLDDGDLRAIRKSVWKPACQ